MATAGGTDREMPVAVSIASNLNRASIVAVMATRRFSRGGEESPSAAQAVTGGTAGAVVCAVANLVYHNDGTHMMHAMTPTMRCGIQLASCRWWSSSPTPT